MDPALRGLQGVHHAQGLDMAALRRTEFLVGGVCVGELRFPTAFGDLGANLSGSTPMTSAPTDAVSLLMVSRLMDCPFVLVAFTAAVRQCGS
jgi:hypothetical protein